MQPGSLGGGPKVRVAAPGNVSVLDRFPAMPPLDLNAFKDKLEPEKSAGKWVVWVFKDVGGKWEKQEDQSFSSDDLKEAEKYFNEAKERDGFTATSNLPKDQSEEIRKALIGTYANYRDSGDLWSRLTLNADGTYSFYWYNLANERNEHSGTWEYNPKEKSVVLWATQPEYGTSHKVLSSGGSYSLSGFEEDKPLIKE